MELEKLSSHMSTLSDFLDIQIPVHEIGAIILHFDHVRHRGGKQASGRLM